MPSRPWTSSTSTSPPTCPCTSRWCGGRRSSPSSAISRRAPRASISRMSSTPCARSSRRTRTCPTRPIPTTGRRSPARRASASSTSSRSWARRRRSSGPSNGSSTPASTCKRHGERERRRPLSPFVLFTSRRPGGLMAIPKVMGIETEYGITVKNQPDFNPILSSLLLINSYETYRSSRIRWDYEAESPLRDARGFEYMEEKEAPSKEESRLINLILSNGARFYVDHAHPEYSSPETTNPRDCVIWDRAGERILDLARSRAEAASPPEQRIIIHKDNTDRKGNSYGTHENYLMDRKVPFARIVQHLMPFFVSRQTYTGSGKVGAENNTEHCDFQISQRADFLETEVRLETMHSRPIINTRDEPHADPEKYRRLHVIVGDANMSEVSNYLKCGTMAIVLSMIEDDFIERDLSLESPVLAYRKVSRDLTCRETFKLKDGRALSALDLQREFLTLGHAYYRTREHEPWVDDVMARWGSVLDRLAKDPMSLARELDWVAKRSLIENYMAKHTLEWSDSRVAMIDLQYHDIRPSKGLYYKLEESDAVERMTTEDEVTKAIYDPPKDTRAYFRGMCLQKYSDEVVSASWDSVIFDLKEGPLKKIFMLEPLRGTEAHVRQLLTESPTAADLLRNISRPSFGM